ncbi:MAG: hypothetical protein K2W33_08990 [Burkholderiales bacterium]|nr:hypothetical protein [Burkholderiales bacterium]
MTPTESRAIESAMQTATRGRKPTPAPEHKAVELNTQAIAQAQTDMNTLALVEEAKHGYDDERDLANQLLGQAQMADAFAKFSVTVTTSKLAFVKENKLYRAFKGKKSRDGHGILAGTWAEYCDLLGRSVEQVDDDIKNLRSFGEDALESMSAMGIGYRELRQYRRLPDDQKQALIEVAKAGDKEGFVELAEEIMVKHAKEKEALAQQLEAKDHRIAENSQRINELEEKAGIRAAMKPDQVLAADQDAALTEFRTTLSYVQGSLRQRFAALMEHEKAGNGSHRHVMAGYIAELEAELDMLKGEFFLRQAAQAVQG